MTLWFDAYVQPRHPQQWFGPAAGHWSSSKSISASAAAGASP